MNSDNSMVEVTNILKSMDIRLSYLENHSGVDSDDTIEGDSFESFFMGDDNDQYSSSQVSQATVSGHSQEDVNRLPPPDEDPHSEESEHSSDPDDLKPSDLVDALSTVSTFADLRAIIVKWEELELKKDLWCPDVPRCKTPILNLIAFEHEWSGPDLFPCPQCCGFAAKTLMR